MWDDPETPRSSRIRRPSAVYLLVIALVFSLSGLAYLLFRPDVRALVFSPGTGQAQSIVPSSTATRSLSSASVQHGIPVQSANNTQSSLTAPPVASQIAGSSAMIGIAGSSSPDLDTMMVQLEQLQRGLLAASSQLEQKSFAARVLPSGASAQPTSGVLGQPPAAGDDLSSTLGEIEQLYQVMQPLMAQIEAASRSSRSPGELEAMRAQMAAIHQRLSDLVVRVEAAKARSGASTSLGTASSQRTAQGTPKAGPIGGEQPTNEQLLAAIAQLQSQMQQLQGQAGSWPPVPQSVPGVGSMPGMAMPSMGGH